MNSSILLEGVNGNFLVFSLAACLIFAYYIWANWGEGYKFPRGAFALSAVFAGEVILRGNFWWARHQINAGVDYQPPVVLTILGSALASWGIPCMILVFSPERWSRRAGIITVGITLTFLYLALAKVI